MARVGTLLPEHEALGPLNEVLVFAAAPELEERYDAAALTLRLQALAIALPEPEPLALAEAIPVGDHRDAERALVRAAGGADRTDATELGVSMPLLPRNGSDDPPTAASLTDPPTP